MKFPLGHVLLALALASAMAAGVHSYWKRIPPAHFAGGFGVTIFINTRLGLPPDPDLEVDSEDLNDARYRRFIDGAAKAAGSCVDPKSMKTVWLSGPNYGRGWPFHSRAPFAKVVFDWAPSESSSIEVTEIWVDEEGGDPFRPLGMVGNALFFFVILLALIQAARALKAEFLRRQNRQPHPFPIVSPESRDK